MGNKGPIDVITDEKTLIVIDEILRQNNQLLNADALSPILKEKSVTNYELDKWTSMSYDELCSLHPYESQLCKYCKYALQETYQDVNNGAMQIFRFFWDNCIAPNLNNETFLFLHVFCKEGHFELLQYLINDIYTSRIKLGFMMEINWTVKDELKKYPIQYLVEWFQYDNKYQIQWTLSYILQRTFGSLMFSKIESSMWTVFVSKACCKCNSNATIDWDEQIEPPSFKLMAYHENIKRKTSIMELSENRNRRLKKKALSYLDNTIVALFGMKSCHWILKYYSSKQNKIPSKQ